MVSALAGGAARGAMFTLVGTWARFVLQLISTMILARILSPADFGLVAMVTAISGLAMLLSDFGLSMASMQARDITDAQKTNLFWLNVGIGSVAAIVVYFLAEPIAGLYAAPQAAEVVRAIAVVYVFHAAVSMLRAELARELRFMPLVVIEVATQFAALVVGIGVAMIGGGYWALVAQLITLPVLLFAGLFASSKWKPKLPTRTDGMKPLFEFGVHTGGVQLINYLSSNIDSVVLGRAWGAAVVGEYGQAYQLFRVPLQQLASPMTRVAVPILSRLDSGRAFRAYVERAQLILVYAIGGAFFTLAAAATPLVLTVLGPNWPQAPMLFRILAIGGIFQTLGYVYYWVFLVRNMTALQLKIGVVSRSLMVVFILVGVSFGAPGVAVGTVLGLALNWILLSVFGIRRAGLSLRALVAGALRPLLLFAVISPLTYLASTYFYATVMPSFVNLFASVSTQVCLALAALAIPVYRRDVKVILSTVKSARRRS